MTKPEHQWGSLEIAMAQRARQPDQGRDYVQDHGKDPRDYRPLVWAVIFGGAAMFWGWAVFSVVRLVISWWLL